MKNSITMALAAITVMTACSKPDIYHNQSFEEISAIAKERKKPFCIALLDNEQYSFGEYESLLQETAEHLAKRAVYNIVDIDEPENDWYVKWLCPMSVPLTCVFSPDGQLTDLIPGANGESFSYIGDAVEQMAATEYRWSNRFNLDKDRAIPILDNILRNKELIANGVFVPQEVDASIDSLRYPYSVWLKLSGQQMTNDTLSAKTTAKELLELETPYFLATYNKEFIEANKVINPGFEIGDEPNIRVAEKTIRLGDRPTDKVLSLEIPVYNDGGKPLKISKIATGCSCLRSLGVEDAVIVAPRDSVLLPFVLSPPGEGGSHQEILLVSNGINNPLLTVNILADFKSDL